MPDWLRALTERGEPSWYHGADLATIGMPIGGIGAGQLYIDRRWPTGALGHLQSERARLSRIPTNRSRRLQVVRAGVRDRSAAGEQSELATTRRRTDFRAWRSAASIRWPRCKYADDAFPVEVTLEAFSPFIPLNAEDSTLPATVMQYTLKNMSDQAVTGHAGRLAAERRVPRERRVAARRIGQHAVRGGERLTTIVCSARASDRPVEERPDDRAGGLREEETTATGRWKARRSAPRRPQGTLPSQNTVSGFQGKGLVNTYLGRR